ncbi:MAG TPA: 30S ribosome-binding factor RbfA [Chloroflexota bacterium]|nr:30S ribosome-binding factor RbfA [Chloroflexota bacterium]
MTSRRILRLNEAIREELAELLRREMRDPRLGGIISITEVDTSPDLALAHVYVSVLGSDEETSDALRALRRAAGYLKRELGDRLRLRRVPNLDFRLDPSLARGARVMELLREIEQG